MSIFNPRASTFVTPSGSHTAVALALAPHIKSVVDSVADVLSPSLPASISEIHPDLLPTLKASALASAHLARACNQIVEALHLTVNPDPPNPYAEPVNGVPVPLTVPQLILDYTLAAGDLVQGAGYCQECINEHEAVNSALAIISDDVAYSADSVGSRRQASVARILEDAKRVRAGSALKGLCLGSNAARSVVQRAVWALEELAERTQAIKGREMDPEAEVRAAANAMRARMIAVEAEFREQELGGITARSLGPAAEIRTVGNCSATLFIDTWNASFRRPRMRS